MDRRTERRIVSGSVQTAGPKWCGIILQKSIAFDFYGIFLPLSPHHSGYTVMLTEYSTRLIITTYGAVLGVRGDVRRLAVTCVNLRCVAFRYFATQDQM